MLGTLLLGLVLACSLFNQAPVARIVANVLSGDSPLVVTFHAVTSTDVDGDITSYMWDFGDGVTDTRATVQHTFTTTEAIEVFRVTLTITDDGGATSQVTQTIEVHSSDDNDEETQGPGMPTARFTASKFFGLAPLRVVFDASSSDGGDGTIVAYNWNFGDGSTATGATLTHTFMPDPEVTTTYPVTLFAWNATGQVDTEQKDIIIIVSESDSADEAPVAEIFVSGPDMIYESNDGSIPSLFEVKFDPRGSNADAGHSIEYYAWDFGDGDIQVETSNLEVTHVYELSAPARTVVVRLTVFDDSGLEDTAIANITLINEEED